MAGLVFDALYELDVFQGLDEGGFEVFAGGFHFYHQQTGEEAVDAVDAFEVGFADAVFVLDGEVCVEAVHFA